MECLSRKCEGSLQRLHTPPLPFLPGCVGLFRYSGRPPACALAHTVILLYNPILLKSPSSAESVILFSSLIMSSVMLGFNFFLCGHCGLKCSYCDINRHYQRQTVAVSSRSRVDNVWCQDVSSFSLLSLLFYLFMLGRFSFSLIHAKHGGQNMSSHFHPV